jgi:DNA-binding CsgD family transcriptional regulator
MMRDGLPMARSVQGFGPRQSLDAVFGREQELGALRGFVAGSREGASALVLEGEAGIGKTTLWSAGVEAAREQRLRVLAARPGATERGLAHAGLGDLLEDVLVEVLPVLPAPRRRALEIALLLAEAEGRAPDTRAVDVAFLTALRALAARGPLMLAIDDVQWLDSSSAAALEFALRRLEEAPLLLLLARRVGEPGPSPEAVLTGERVERLDVGPLSLGATHRLLRRRLGRSFSRPTLVRMHELSGGNPFFALELARALERAGVAPGLTESFPVPETLEVLVRERLQALPQEGRPVLLAAAALAEPTMSLLASGWDDAAAVLEPALRAGIVGVEGDRVRFAHPLLASVLYEHATDAERRRLHGRVAWLVEDPVERARHLALEADGPDDVVAQRLDEAADVARTRGAPIAAAELRELALRATRPQDVDDRRGRMLQAARDHLAAGADDRARALGQELLAEAPSGSARAEALVLLSEVEGQEGIVNSEIELLKAASREACASPDLELVIQWKLGNAVRFGEGTGAGMRHARAALQLAERIGDDALTSHALATLAELMGYAGEADAIALAERSLVLGRRALDREAVEHAQWALGACFTWAGRAAEARDHLREAYASMAGRDDVKAKLVLWLLAVAELRAGRWDLAREYAEERLEIAEMLGEVDANTSIPLALVSAYRGEEREARQFAEAGIELAEASGTPFFASWHRGVLGMLEHWAGRPALAVELFSQAMRARESAGFREPGSPLYRGDYVEALLELGRIDEALAVLDSWEADAARLGRGWALAEATRCRGLVAAARGDVTDAERLMEQAVVQYVPVGDAFGRARALLALGVVRRRARRKQSAREAVEQAVAAFETLGAVRWAEKARAELGSIGGRIREEGLTQAERRVATLVAQGRTNREVAAVLFLSERTVESHLTRVYAKVGVRSRTELARAFP